MPNLYEIRADYDRNSITVYQAYRAAIAEPALKNQRFVPPFSYNRMTWIKPSFLWMMHRSNWGQKSGQEYILALRISREGWEKALSQAVLTSPEKSVHGTHGAWKKAFRNATVHIQWDPERSFRGAALNYYSIQVGLSRHIIREFAEKWVLSITDSSQSVRKMRNFIKSGRADNAKKLLPKERIYPIAPEIGKRIMIG